MPVIASNAATTGAAEGMPTSAVVDPNAVLRGGLLGNRYRVERILGKGGGGMVVAATHVALGLTVAVKFLARSALASAEAVARFEREAQATARLRGPHVVRVFDIDRTPAGVPFLVMEYLEGSTLADVLRRAGRLPVPQAAEWFLQACEGLAEAHAMGITHRDLKPSNLFVCLGADGTTTIKLIDFGISKMPDDNPVNPGRPLTDSRTVLGSPGFIAPEQLRASRNADARSDIWALGATLYQAIAGRPAFDDQSVAEMHASILTTDPPPIDSPDVPRAVERIIFRCLEKKPEMRFQDVAELAVALAPFAPEHARSGVMRVMTLLASERLCETSIRDPLTQAFSRRYFETSFASEVSYANRHKSRLAVVLFDIDHLKNVNEAHGHLAGDEVLKRICAQVARMIRVEDVFARYDAQQFVVLARGSEHEDVALFAERIRRAVERLAISWQNEVIRPTVSVGVASLSECGDVGTSEGLLLIASERLYQAKRDGHDRVVSS